MSPLTLAITIAIIVALALWYVIDKVPIIEEQIALSFQRDSLEEEKVAIPPIDRHGSPSLNRVGIGHYTGTKNGIQYTCIRYVDLGIRRVYAKDYDLEEVPREVWISWQGGSSLRPYDSSESWHKTLGDFRKYLNSK